MKDDRIYLQHILERIWEIVQRDVPELRRAVDGILRD